MENILYLDDYINLYNQKKNLLIIEKPYNDTLKYGKISDHLKFIKKYNNLVDKYKLNQNFFSSSITVIVNGTYTKVNFISEHKYLKLNRKNIVINANHKYILIYYLDKSGNTEILTLDNKAFLDNILKEALKLFKNKKIYMFGKDYESIISLLDDNAEYYYYEDSENFIMNKIINDKSMSNIKNK